MRLSQKQSRVVDNKESGVYIFEMLVGNILVYLWEG